MEPTDAIKPIGVLGIHLRRVAELLADSATFRQRTGAADRTAAFERIKYPFLRFRSPLEVDTYFGGLPAPAAVIEAEACEWGIRGIVGMIHLRLLLVDYDRHPGEGEEEASLTDFLNFIEGVLVDLAKQWLALGLPIPRVSLIMPTLDNARRRGREGGYWLGGAEIEWEGQSLK